MRRWPKSLYLISSYLSPSKEDRNYLTCWNQLSENSLKIEIGKKDGNPLFGKEGITSAVKYHRYQNTD